MYTCKAGGKVKANCLQRRTEEKPANRMPKPGKTQEWAAGRDGD